MSSISSNDNKIALWTYFLAETPQDNKYGAVAVLGTFNTIEEANDYWEKIDTSEYRLKKLSTVGKFTWLYGDLSAAPEIEYVDSGSKHFQRFSIKNNVRKTVKHEKKAREWMKAMEEVEAELEDDESLAKYAQLMLKMNTYVNTYNMYVKNINNVKELAKNVTDNLSTLDEKYPEYTDQWEDYLKKFSAGETHPSNLSDQISTFKGNKKEYYIVDEKDINPKDLEELW